VKPASALACAFLTKLMSNPPWGKKAPAMFRQVTTCYAIFVPKQLDHFLISCNTMLLLRNKYFASLHIWHTAEAQPKGFYVDT
jgi:hypothetical protein